jgi:hypothetical protein
VNSFAIDYTCLSLLKSELGFISNFIQSLYVLSTLFARYTSELLTKWEIDLYLQ